MASPFKSKLKGRSFEYRVRKFLREKGWFVYSKGVSTPGPDILGIKENHMLIMELKSYKQVSFGKLQDMEKLGDKIISYIKEYQEPLKYFSIHPYVLMNDRSQKVIYSYSPILDSLRKHKSLSEFYDEFLRNINFSSLDFINLYK